MRAKNDVMVNVNIEDKDLQMLGIKIQPVMRPDASSIDPSTARARESSSRLSLNSQEQEKKEKAEKKKKVEMVLQETVDSQMDKMTLEYWNQMAEKNQLVSAKIIHEFRLKTLVNYIKERSQFRVKKLIENSVMRRLTALMSEEQKKKIEKQELEAFDTADS